jgi:hypothetical protein
MPRAASTLGRALAVPSFFDNRARRGYRARAPMASNPHDKLIKFTFSQVENAADEFRTALPPALAARLDFSTLCVCPGSFVDEALRERFTDLLYLNVA